MLQKILIVKTSSLGDIIQCLPILLEIKQILPNCEIHWLVKKNFHSLLKAHPLVKRVIVFDFKKPITSLKQVREENYDILIDLQGNSKSAIITFLAKAKEKVGFGKNTVRELPNLLVTTHKYNITKDINIRQFYLQLVRKHLQKSVDVKNISFLLSIPASEKEKISRFLSYASPEEIKIMVCPGSMWENKRLDQKALYEFLAKILKNVSASIFLSWGTQEEKKEAIGLQNKLGKKCIVMDRFAIPTWQNFIAKMDVVIAVDSAALHLSATTKTPSFSVFGPTSSKVFMPESHFSIQGTCPYGVKFKKQCPYLRSCDTGSCIKEISAQKLWDSFEKWFKSLKIHKT